ncbi:exocyst complex component 3-like protein 4 [Cheilinus undulatus]|uniref:exocyst complex component 3-like protein 4 n=1 Tax=Cheilinus undulatus TaxID=241271 RepID=UPI001BD2BE13|nr:exocyst complex component 3-like protein 4 [Cheilinus undulatus]
MRKIFKRKTKLKRDESRRLLVESNNNNLQEGHDLVQHAYNNPSVQNCVSANEEQLCQSLEMITPERLAEILGVAPEGTTSVDGSCCLYPPESNSGQQTFVLLIQQSVSQRFPTPPTDLNENLPLHLDIVQETVHNELAKLHPLLNSMGLTGCLIDCYLHQMFEHLDYILQNIRSTKSAFVLMKWVVNSCLSPEFLGLQELDPVKRIDPLQFSEWVIQAKNKLLENVQKDVKQFLEKILRNERNQDGRDTDEAYVQLYVDTVGCIKDLPKAAQEISSELSQCVQEICYTELLGFLERYTAEQTEFLSKEAKMDKPNMWHFFKTLNTCKELKMHVQEKSTAIQRSLLQETVEMLGNMEDFTLKLIMEIIADLAERHLKNYFKADNKRFFLIRALREYFPKTQRTEDIQKRVLDEAYKLIAHIYLVHLLQNSRSKLQKRWSLDLGQTVAEDAKLLHNTMAELAPGVQQWNLMLLKVAELLGCNDIDAMKLIVATMQRNSQIWSEDLDLLPTLLCWKGLPRWQVREVLDAVDANQPKPVSCFSILKCW